MRLSNFLSAAFLLFPTTALAAGAERTLGGLSQTGQAAGFGAQSASFTVFLANAINAILGLSGVILVCILVYAGVQYLTSGGDQEKVKHSKTMITSAVVGIVIVATSYLATAFLFDQLSNVVDVQQTGTQITPEERARRLQQDQLLELQRNGGGF